MAKLTDKFIRATKGTGKDQFHGDGAGLYLRVTPIGSRTWVYRYKNSDGKTRWFDIGIYPARSLAEARADAAALKVKRRNGIDPAVERTQQHSDIRAAKEEEARNTATLNARTNVQTLFDHWMSLEISRRKDQGAETRRMFNKDILPVIGTFAVADIRKSHISAITDAVLSRGGEGRMPSIATVR